MRARIVQIVFSLVLGSAGIAFGQLDCDLPAALQFTSTNCELRGATAGCRIGTGEVTNHVEALGLVSPAKGDPPDPLSYSSSQSQQKKEDELCQPSLTSKIRLADLTQTVSPGWRIGQSGLLSYTTRDERWQLVFRYTPDLSALRESFDQLHAFSVTWQYRFLKHKPAR
jgi:hypothetical protein